MAPRHVVLDTCLVITFGNAEALQVISELQAHEVVTCPRVVREVTRPPAVTALNDAVAHGDIELTSIDPEVPRQQNALRRFDAMPAFRDRAEAEVLALAKSRNMIVASDENAVRRTARRELGRERVAGTLDFLVWAVREGRLTVRDAEDLLDRLDVGEAIARRIRNEGRTFGDLL